MSSQTKIFFLGATGYIGGAVLNRLFAHPKASTFEITALVRKAEKAAQLQDLGIKTELGSLADLDKLERLASDADVVISIADCDDVPSIQAILRGLKKKYTATQKQPILIHTSGTGVLTENSRGQFGSGKIYHDTNSKEIESLPLSQPHRPVDVTIVEADKQGFVRTHIILPSTIFGLGTGLFSDKGISNPHSIQLPTLLKAGWLRGQGAMVGEGKNVWPCVHIDDQADFFIILVDAALSNPDTPHGREGYYFGENGEYRFHDLAKAICKALAAHGRGTEEPTSFTEEELKTGTVSYLGSPCRCRADRARALGWKPTKGEKDLLDSVRPELEALVKSGAINVPLLPVPW